MTAARKIIIDTDPGQDDAVAIMMALASSELEVLAITCVAGNVPLELTSLNARKVCDLAGRFDVPVHAGCSKPLVRMLTTAEHVHGKTGLDGAELPEPRTPLAQKHAVDVIVETLAAAEPRSITLCTLGPLTNIAAALIRAPEMRGAIREIVSMGGGFFEGGNITPAAEFNIYVDPHAAETVFRSGLDVTLMPLDLTHQVRTTNARMARLRGLGTRVGRVTADLLDFFDRFDEEKYGTDGGPLHDPNVIAYLLKPEIYGGRRINVEVETVSELTMGMTVADWWGVSDREPNLFYVKEVDADAFFDLVTDLLAKL